LALVAAVALAATSCAGLGYYGQAAWGQMRLLVARRPIETVIRDPSTPAALRAKLATVQRLRRFAVEGLGLPDNGSYRGYVELDRPFVVWNVVAAPELSVEPRVWCFPVAGCVSYRGYFSEDRARRFAERLRRQGYDVDVGGVAAYSTLGWFRDPLLSTVIDYPEPDLAGLIFHELAHQEVYVKDDSPFDESFATTVEIEGVRRWLQASGAEPDAVERYRRSKQRYDELVALALAYRDRLQEVYASPASDDEKRRRKREILGELRAANRDPDYAEWFAQDLNNAHLASIGAYNDFVPAFQALLAENDGDLPRFYDAVRELAGLEPEARAERLGELQP